MNIRKLKYVLFGEDKLSRVMGGVSQASDKATESLDQQSSKLAKLRGEMKGVASEMPAVGNALGKIASRAALIGTAMVGIGKTIAKANTEAQAFNHTFLDIEQLNLDKTEAQINRLKRNVLNLAYSRGFDAQKTATGTFDVQSITGKYGEEVEQVVDKVGRFAQMMKADFNKSIAGASQAMEIFGFGVSKMDKFLASSYKTVLVGKTTFDELSKVQVEYAQSAASAGQDFDAANKVFAAFSKNAKSVDIAATLTKTSFQDLAKASTIKGLRNIGVSLFDARNKMLGIDEIMGQLVPKLKGMDDVRFAALKEDVGGSEGLRALLDMAKNSGDALLATFEAFDKATYDPEKAMANALKDTTLQFEILDNKMNAAMAKFGQHTLGIKGIWKQMKLGFVEFINTVADGMDYIEMGPSERRAHNTKIAKEDALARIKNQDPRLAGIIEGFENLDEDAFNRRVSQLMELRLEKMQEAEKINVGTTGSWAARQGRKKQKNSLYEEAQAYFDLSDDLRKIWTDGRKGAENKEAFGAETSDVTGGVPEPDSVKKGLGVVSGGGAIRNINVTVQKFTEAVNVNSTNVTEGTAQVMDILGEYFIRMIQGAETAIQS